MFTDTLLNVFLAIAVDNLANAQELTKVELVGRCFSSTVTTCSWQIRTMSSGEGKQGWGQSFYPGCTVPRKRHVLPRKQTVPIQEDSTGKEMGGGMTAGLP